jgi:hypothetical protein
VRRKSQSRKPRPEERDREVETEAETETAADGEEAETAVNPAAAPTDNVGDISVEVNVEDLIAEIESESTGGPGVDGSARRKIEDILEEKRVAKEIMDLEDFDVDE